jgi:mitochondrial import inner membrane translocase subunit TIM50
MSFLLPTLRSTFRSNLRTTTNILRQQYYVTHQLPIHRQWPSTARFYSRRNPAPNNSKSEPENKAIEDPVTPDLNIPKDPLSGDIQAAPGSILSEYVSSPQDSAQLEATISGSGSGGLPKKEEYVSSTDRKRERIARILTWGTLLGLLGGSIWLGRPLEKEEQERMGWATVSP